MRIFFRLGVFLLYALIFFIPLQTRLVLYREGPRFIEWNAAFLYLTDFFIAGIICVWGIPAFVALVRSTPWHTFRERPRLTFPLWTYTSLALFYGAGFLSLIGSGERLLSGHYLLRIAEGMILFLFIRAHVRFFSVTILAGVWMVSAALQALLASLQFFTQHDLGLTHIEAGPLGEAISGVATISLPIGKIIRGYGTFPHPNVLAAFLLVGLFSLYYMFFYFSRKPLNIAKRIFFDFVFWIILSILVLGLFITFSRAALLLGVTGSFLFFAGVMFVKDLRERYGKAVLQLFGVFCISCVFVVSFLQPYLFVRFGEGARAEALETRAPGIKEGIEMARGASLTGVGIGAYSFELLQKGGKGALWQYEPVHNTYILVGAEIGIIGGIAFIFFLAAFPVRAAKKIYRDRTTDESILVWGTSIVFISFLALMMFDHYFWTLQQGRLMLWVMVGILFSLLGSSVTGGVRRGGRV